MRDVAVLGVGMHPFGKFQDKSVTDLCRHATEAALQDAGLKWSDVEAVSAASSRFSGGKGWGLNGNDIVEEMGASGIPVYNLSAGCAAGGNAFNIGWNLIASGQLNLGARIDSRRVDPRTTRTSQVPHKKPAIPIHQASVLVGNTRIIEYQVQFRMVPADE